MRNVDSNIIAQWEGRQFTEFWLLELAFAQTHRYTDFDRSITVTDRFMPRDFKVASIRGAAGLSVDSVRVEIANGDAVMSSILQSSDCRFRPCKLWAGVMVDFTPYAHLLFQGLLAEWDATEKDVTLEIVNEFFLWRKRTLRVVSPSCPWPFKGTECAYAGASAWCDQSYERCSTLGNTANFGGDRFAPSTAEKQIWWGRVPT